MGALDREKSSCAHHISYELNALTRRPEVLPLTYSALHQHILDRFAAAGVEIMSPNYLALRDGNALTLPLSPRETPSPLTEH